MFRVVIKNSGATSGILTTCNSSMFVASVFCMNEYIPVLEFENDVT